MIKYTKKKFKSSILTEESIIEKTYSSKISPNPSFPKRGNSSLL